MKKDGINFSGLSLGDAFDEKREGNTSLLVNMTDEDHVLRPLSPTPIAFATMPPGTRLLAVHAHNDYTHLITGHTSQEGQWHYAWIDGRQPGQPHPIVTLGEPLCAVSAVGNVLCLVGNSHLLYAPWDSSSQDYSVLSRSDFLYDITLTQHDQTCTQISAPLPSSALRKTDAPKVLSAIENAIDERLSQMGDNAHKHVAFGVAVVRLFDGSHTLVSNIFTLIPSTLPRTLEIDSESGEMHYSVYLHRHQITVSLRESNATVLNMIQGIDIYLTHPVTMLAPDSMTVTTDAEGHPATITFSHLPLQATKEQFAQLRFYKSMRIECESLGERLPLPRVSGEGESIDLSDLRRWSVGGSHAYSYDNRLHLASTRLLIHNPFEIGLHYVYADSLNTTGTPVDLLGGHRADLMGSVEGTIADVVMSIRLNHSPRQVYRFCARVQYPIPGLLMFPCEGAYHCELHVRVTTESGQKHYVCRQSLHPHAEGGFSFAVYGAAGAAHSSPRPIIVSLLYQQARLLTYDTDLGLYTPSYLLWQEETAEQFDAEAALAAEQWELPQTAGDIRSSLRGNPLVLPSVSHISVGGGIIGVSTNTRRSGDGQFGDCQYYVFTDDGVWVLKMTASGGWKAHQAVSHDRLLSAAGLACTDEAVAYISQRGLILLRGTVARCLSEPLQGCPFDASRLPLIDQILSTTPDLSSLPLTHVPIPGDFLPMARVIYDDIYQRIIIFNTTLDERHQPRYPLALVYSLRSESWGTIEWPFTDSITHRGQIWVTHGDGDGQTVVSQLDFTADTPIPFAFCSRPLSMGSSRTPRRLVRGFVEGKTGGSCEETIITALYGSNDLYRWYLLGANAGPSLAQWHGTPFRWLRLVVAGKLRRCGWIKGVRSAK